MLSPKRCIDEKARGIKNEESSRQGSFRWFKEGKGDHQILHESNKFEETKRLGNRIKRKQLTEIISRANPYVFYYKR